MKKWWYFIGGIVVGLLGLWVGIKLETRFYADKTKDKKG